MSRVGGKIRVGRITPIQQFFFFWPYGVASVTFLQELLFFVQYNSLQALFIPKYTQMSFDSISKKGKK